jgi:hypothetical protein
MIMKNQKIPERVEAIRRMLQPEMLIWLVGALVLVTLFRILYFL